MAAVMSGVRRIIISFRNITSFLPQMHNIPFRLRLPLIAHFRGVALTPTACGKYHHVKKKRRLREERRDRLEARLEKMDPEDRPTGCLLCSKRGNIEIDYKNVRLLSQFVSPHTGRIYGKEATGLCMYKQNEIKKTIRKSRSLGYMPFTMKYFSFHNDPKLF